MIACIPRTAVITSWSPIGSITHVVSVTGMMTYVSLEQHSRQILATYRPKSGSPSVRHCMYELSTTHLATHLTSPGNDFCTLNIVQTFYGGSIHKLLSRSRLVLHPDGNDRLLVCAGDEASQSVSIVSTYSNISQALKTMSNTTDLKFPLIRECSLILYFLSCHV